MSSIEELMPDPDRREAALLRIRQRVLNDAGYANGQLAPRVHQLAPRVHQLAPLVDRVSEYVPRPVSAQERRVLAALGGGLTVPETADVLGATLESVKDSVKQVKRKLRAKTAAQLCANAVREGIIE